MTVPQPAHDEDEYPLPIQRAGMDAMVLYDHLESALLADGFDQQDADMLLVINIPKVIEAATHYHQQTQSERLMTLRTRLGDILDKVLNSD